MSGRKRILYNIFCVFAFLCAVVGTVLLAVFGALHESMDFTSRLSVFCAAFVSLILFPLFNLAVHELGHLFFGLCCGMKPVSVQIGHWFFSRRKVQFVLRSRADGASVMLARRVGHLRGKLIFSALGGIVCNFIYGTVFLTLWFLIPSPAILFFALFAPLNFYEGIMALVPAQLPEGATDGAVIAGLIKKKPFAENMLAVIRAQSFLQKKTYLELPRKWLFDVPVVREDERSFLALTQLRAQYLYRTGDNEGAAVQLKRLEELFGYGEDVEFSCDLAYAYAVMLDDLTRAREYFEQAKDAKGALAYRVAAAAVGKEEIAAVTEAAEREKCAGIRDYSLYALEEAEKKKSAEKSAPQSET